MSSKWKPMRNKGAKMCEMRNSNFQGIRPSRESRDPKERVAAFFGAYDKEKVGTEDDGATLSWNYF